MAQENLPFGGIARTRLYLNIGVTAHRDLVEADIPRLRAQCRAFFEDLQRAFPALPLRLVSALASGGDQLAAEEAFALGIEVMVPLPLPQAEYERDFHDAQALAHFQELLAKARQRTLPMASGNTADAVRERGPARNRQYAQLGMFVSSRCQILLALWDGEPSDATGGTAQVVGYHLHNAMPGFSAADAAPNLLADDESDLVYHIRCSRRLASTQGASNPAAAAPRWLTAEGDTAPGSPMPAQYRHVFGQMQDFNRDALRHAEAIDREAASLLAHDLPAAAPVAAREVDALFGAADWLAVHFRRRVRISMLLTHAFAAAMGLAFILYSDLDTNRTYIAVFLLLFGMSVLIRWIGKRREWHRKYLDYRGLAEGLRVQMYWRLAGVEPPPNDSLGYDSFLQKQDVDLSWIRHAMRSTGLPNDEGFQPDGRWLQWVIDAWVGQRDSGSGQLAYFAQGTRRREQAYAATTRLGELALDGGVVGAIALLLFGARMGSAAQTLLLLAMGLLPLLAGIREAFSYKNADKELIKQFRFMSRLFGSCRARLDLSGDPAESRYLLRSLGNACLEEHAEWILLHRERPIETSVLSG